jgi:hypothetical protein
MLLKSIQHHKNMVDRITVCIQIVSNKGEHAECDNIILNKLIEVKEIDVIKFTSNLLVSTKENERNKHNDMIEYAKNMGATHFIMAAADHFYSENTINKGKEIILSDKYDLIVTKMKTYYKHFNWMIWPLEDYYMPFIHKVSLNTFISGNVHYPVLVDPSVKVTTSKNIYIMPENEGLLHHYSMIRKDISKKFNNAAASIRWTPEQIETFENEYKYASVGDCISYFKYHKIIIDLNPLILNLNL